MFQACKDGADATLFMFSAVDKSSFEDLPQQMSRILDPVENLCKFIIGTKYPWLLVPRAMCSHMATPTLKVWFLSTRGLSSQVVC